MTTANDKADMTLFWGCFIALVTTAFGFIGRMFLISNWQVEFNLDPAEAGKLQGVGVWPFALSIIGFSLIIDRVGYKLAMLFAFLGHITWVCMGVGAFFLSKNGDKATAYQLLYWGSLILGLANGTVEAFINPVVATMFNHNKTKWLNILHAGWPGGLVIAGIITIFLGDLEWWIKIAILAAPAVIYFLMLLSVNFPVQEREAAGVSFRDMLAEFGVLGALVVGFILALQLMDFFKPAAGPLEDWKKYLFIGIGAAVVIGFGLYTLSFGRFLMFFLILIMVPLATTEIGTDGWITGIMEPIAKESDFHPGWVLVYTSAIMMVLRFFAGPIIRAATPLGLLAVSSILAIVGLSALSFATAGLLIFIAATLYGFGKTFFWPTMLGVVSEQMPRGGALTLNAISGIGMLAVGTLGFPYIGTLQADKQIQVIQSSEEAKKLPGLVVDGKLTTTTQKDIYEIIKYTVIDDAAFSKFTPKTAEASKRADSVKEELKKAAAGKDVSEKEVKAKLESDSQYQALAKTDEFKNEEAVLKLRARATQGALLNMAIFPGIMLLGYIILLLYYSATGGYKPVELDGKPAGGHH
jgi:MFS family permease